MKAASRILLLPVAPKPGVGGPPGTTSVARQIRPPRRSPFRAETGSDHEFISVIGDPASRPIAKSLSRQFAKYFAFRFFLAFLLIVAFQFARYTAQASSSSNNRNWQRPGNNKPVRPSPWGRNKKLARARSIDGIDYIEFESKAPKDQKKQPSPEGATTPSSTTDLDESDNALDDLSVDTPRRKDQNVVQFSVRELGAVSARAPGTIELFLRPVPSFYCLHEHIRERAPPSLVSPL